MPPPVLRSSGPRLAACALAGLVAILAAPSPSAAQVPAGGSPPTEAASPSVRPAAPETTTQDGRGARPGSPEPAAATVGGPSPAAGTATRPLGVADAPAAPSRTASADAPRSAALPHDLSPWGMFMAADRVVKGVMIGLAVASLATWTILLAKGMELLLAKRRARSGVNRLRRAGTLREAIGAGGRRWRGPVASLARIAEEERERSDGLPPDGIKERVSVALSRVEAGAGRAMGRGTGLLATIGATAPFVGLFGTVWGIMNAFIGISEANTTNLAVVAPGIAEALLATAIGLVAAIPAVVIFNVFARSIAGYRAVLSDGSAIVLQHLSRELDRRAAGLSAPAGRLARTSG